MENKEEVQSKYPSICYSCRNARKPASDENRDKGYVGCAEYARNDGAGWDYIKEVKELAIGWVDLRSSVFGNKSGIITNLQLLTLEVKNCSKHESQTL